jgi:kynurenine formamidase
VIVAFVGTVVYTTIKGNNSEMIEAEEGSNIIDLTYNFDEYAIYWPTGKDFKLEKVPGTWEITEQGYWYASNDYGPANEHGGTHVDAPIHFSRGGRTIDQIPLEEWIAPAIVIDVSQECASDPDYLLTVDDIKEWEKEYGEIPDGAWVVMNSGWGKYWHNKEALSKNQVIFDF